MNIENNTTFNLKRYYKALHIQEKHWSSSVDYGVQWNSSPLNIKSNKCQYLLSIHTVWTNQQMQQWKQIMLDLKLINLARHPKPSYKSKDAKQHISKILIKSRNAKLSQTLVKHKTYSKANIVSHNAPVQHNIIVFCSQMQYFMLTLCATNLLAINFKKKNMNTLK